MPPEAKSAPPSIYSNMAKMAMAPKAPTAGGDAGGGGMEEKKQIVITLTSVLKKWEELEKDPKGKQIIQQMADSVKQYQTEVLKEGATGANAGAPVPPTGAGGPGGGAGPEAASAAGASGGGGGGEKAA
jgi:hypothetical protein